MCVALPSLVLPRRAILEVVRFWARSNHWLLRTVCGITFELRGLERIPPGPLLVASKHQSLWETFALVPLFADPAFILKRELMWLPFFGWLARKGPKIPVDRGARSPELAAPSAPAPLPPPPRPHPGAVRAEFPDPIAPGLDKQVFFERLQQAIETATARLIREGER